MILCVYSQKKVINQQEFGSLNLNRCLLRPPVSALAGSTQEEDCYEEHGDWLQGAVPTENVTES